MALRERLGFWPRKSPQPFGFAKGKKEKEWKGPSGSKGFSRTQSKYINTSTQWRHLSNKEQKEHQSFDCLKKFTSFQSITSVVNKK